MYVVQVKPLGEYQVRNDLRNRGIKALLPLQMLTERRGGYWVGVPKKLFAGYIFVDIENISDEDYYKILSCDGILRFLGPKGKPEKLQPKEIELIRVLSSENLTVKLATVTFVEGQTYSIEGVVLKAIEVSRRQQRGKFELELAGEKHIITLSCNFKSEEQTNESEEQGLIRPLGGSNLS